MFFIWCALHASTNAFAFVYFQLQSSCVCTKKPAHNLPFCKTTKNQIKPQSFQSLSRIISFAIERVLQVSLSRLQSILKTTLVTTAVLLLHVTDLNKKWSAASIKYLPLICADVCCDLPHTVSRHIPPLCFVFEYYFCNVCVSVSVRSVERDVLLSKFWQNFKVLNC